MQSRVNRKDLFRVVDVNFNRAKEGLRVCEDVVRLVLGDKRLTSKYKAVRHELSKAIVSFGLKEIVAARNIQKDVGKPTTFSESKRSSVEEIFYANSQRVKESLRVLEEFAKLVNTDSAETLKRLRYAVYALEQTTFGRI